MTRKEHLTQEQFDALKARTLSPEETVTALTHMAECTQCADAFADSYREEELLSLPNNFKTKILETVSMEAEKSNRNVFAVKTMRTQKKKSGKQELYAYSFRVCVAASIALMLLFSGTLNYGLSLGRSITNDFTATDRIAENLRGFSDRLIDFTIKTDKEGF